MADQELEQEVTEELETEEISEEEQEDEKPEIEPWMEEEQETVPVGAIASVRKKLKGRISEKDEEIERLKEELKELKNKSSSQLEIPKKPKLSDFDSDEEYETALDKWLEDKENAKFQTFEQKREQERKAQMFKESLEKSVNSHYERAEKLVKDYSISPEVYQKADQAVREATESVMPKHGELIVDQLINVLGEGSEKVMYYLGKNKAALNEYASLLREDPGGLKASAYLGKLSNKLSSPTKKRSQAPPPAPDVSGDAGTSAKESTLKKKWSEAHKKGNTQLAYNIKKEGKESGFDVTKW